jgi:hypothetical protein
MKQGEGIGMVEPGSAKCMSLSPRWSQLLNNREIYLGSQDSSVLVEPWLTAAWLVLTARPH